MRSEEFSAKTVEEAVKKAMDAFGVNQKALTYEIITEPTKGFLGIGARHAVIKASVIEAETAQEPEVQPTIAESKPAAEKVMTELPAASEEKRETIDAAEAAEMGRDYLAKIFSEMHLNTDIVVEQKEDYLIFDIQGEDLGILIGRRGDTLDALQFLLNLVINRRTNAKIKILIDIENYRAKREETLVALSHKLASKAKRPGQKVILEPMNPQERRIIHMTLQDDDGVNTYSEGEEPYRKVIIVPKKKQQNKRR